MLYSQNLAHARQAGMGPVLNRDVWYNERKQEGTLQLDIRVHEKLASVEITEFGCRKQRLAEACQRVAIRDVSFDGNMFLSNVCLS